MSTPNMAPTHQISAHFPASSTPLEEAEAINTFFCSTCYFPGKLLLNYPAISIGESIISPIGAPTAQTASAGPVAIDLSGLCTTITISSMAMNFIAVKLWFGCDRIVKMGHDVDEEVAVEKSEDLVGFGVCDVIFLSKEESDMHAFYWSMTQFMGREKKECKEQEVEQDRTKDCLKVD